MALFELAELLENRAAVNQRVADDLRRRLAGFGLELVEAALQDVMVGGELNGERRSEGTSARSP